MKNILKKSLIAFSVFGFICMVSITGAYAKGAAAKLPEAPLPAGAPDVKHRPHIIPAPAPAPVPVAG